ncbi:MAG: hypothetical protein A2Y93_11100 [Chloroflexi bacterium RBG_13_68_17]|nr:MAG: hypothetical protein A2Y93_11100 [Chloroflexi bacterium RBG_13_68_17]
MSRSARALGKQVLGHVPLAAEAAQWLKPDGAIPISGYSLDRLAERLPAWRAAAAQARAAGNGVRPRRVLVFGYLRWWLECACAIGLLLAAEGHDVDLAFLPHQRWTESLSLFDIRRQRVYVRRILASLAPLLRVLSLHGGEAQTLEPELEHDLERLSRIDVQYTCMREILDLGPQGRDTPLFHLRQERNRAAARAALRLLRRTSYDAVVVPNGSILEFGAVYHAARRLGVPVVTYEFGEQRERMWLAHDAEVMRMDISPLWQVRGQDPLTPTEAEAIRTLYGARRGARLWAHFGRQWQVGESRGAQAARAQLGLDPKRPMVLLCTNVVGDSLSLGREVYSDGMAGWLMLTARHFAGLAEAQLVVRVHPGESYGTGHPSVDIVRQAVPALPGHVIVVPPDSSVNTYDLIELAHLGLVYTSTSGIEMAMNGVPVIVSGATHYRRKGFTHEPTSEAEYLRTLDELLRQPLGRRLDDAVVEKAWRYAHRFFFEFPFPFPWHIEHFWEDMQARPFETVIRAESRRRYRPALEALAGLPIDWRERARQGREWVAAAVPGAGG